MEFLGIGVLNSVNYAEKVEKMVLSSWVKGNIDDGEDFNPWFDPDAVSTLRKIQEAYNFKIVISSTWRYHLTIDDFNKVFNTYYDWDTTGIIVGKTDTESGIRGVQIKRWLDNHGKFPYSYLIIDDSSDMLETQMPYLLHLNVEHGLRERDLVEVEEILGEP